MLRLQDNGVLGVILIDSFSNASGIFVFGFVCSFLANPKKIQLIVKWNQWEKHIF